MVNIFGHSNHRTDHMGADHAYGPRRRRRASVSSPHIAWSNPLVTQPLVLNEGPPSIPFVPQYTFSSYPHQKSAKASPHHRFTQPRRGILREAPQRWLHQPLTAPNTHLRGTPFVPETPFNRIHTPQSRRRNSSPFSPGCYGQHDNPFQRCSSIRRTPCQPPNTPLQFSPSVPPPAPIQPTFGGAQQSSGYPFQSTQTPMTISRAVPELPQEVPSLTQWNFPAGTLAWSPHPAPHPNVPANAFWSGNTALQGLAHTAPRQSTNAPLDPWQAARLTGGWPLPGADPRWTPGTWPPVAWGASVPVRLAPCLIPNPANPDMPQIVWDISQNPSRAQRITGAHTIISLSSQFHQQAIVPATEEVHIAVQSPFVQRLWGSIAVTTKSKVTVWDILSAIYEFFQIQLTQTEVDYIQSLDQRNYDTLVDAYRARCNVTPALPGFERLQGLRRIDILGDKRGFWGLWITFDDISNSWHLNLGLVSLRPGPGW